MKGNRYLFIQVDNNQIVDSEKCANDKAALKVAAQLSKRLNDQIVVFRGIAIVDERPSMYALFEDSTPEA